MFRKAANLAVVKDSIQSRQPPEPDILCEIAGAGRVSFELVEVVGTKFPQYTDSRPALRRRFAEAYAAVSTEVRTPLEARLGGPPAVIVGFVRRTSPGQWLNAIKLILDTLEEYSTTIEPGEFRLDLVPRLQRYLTDMWIHSEGPRLRVHAEGQSLRVAEAEATLVADPAVERIRAKFAKSYKTTAPIELVAYYVGQPAPSDGIWKLRISRLFESELARSPFRRVWIFDGSTRAIVTDSDSAAALDSLVRLRLAQPIAQRLADLPRGTELATLAVRGAKFKGGRPAGALDDLDRVVIEILKADHPRMHADDVLTALRAKAGTGTVVRIRTEGLGPLRRAPGGGKRRAKGTIVVWRHARKGEQETAWSTIRTHRLSRLRALLLAKPR